MAFRPVFVQMTRPSGAQSTWCGAANFPGKTLGPTETQPRSEARIASALVNDVESKPVWERTSSCEFGNHEIP
jgi:hypothetical protein